MTINEAQITQLEKRARGFRRIIAKPFTRNRA